MNDAHPHLLNKMGYVGLYNFDSITPDLIYDLSNLLFYYIINSQKSFKNLQVLEHTDRFIYGSYNTDSV